MSKIKLKKENKMTTKAKQTETENETINNQLADEVFGKKETSPEQLLKRQRALRNMKYNSIPRTQAKSLLGVEFDILDAVRCVINGDASIQFILKNKSNDEVVSVSKSANAYNDVYADYFETFDEGETEPMEGYTFLEEGAPKNGNRPIVIRKL